MGIARDFKAHYLSKSWEMRLMLTFDLLIALFVILYPLFSPGLYAAAQSALALLFLGMFAGDSAMGRDGTALARHHGWRRFLDHAYFWAMIALTVVLAENAPEHLFRVGWLVGAVCLGLTYLLVSIKPGRRLDSPA
jgi:hypothetical protein